MQEPIPIVFAANDRYVPVTSVALLSLLDHVSADREYHIFILHVGIAAENRDYLESLSTKHVIIKCKNVLREMEDKPVCIMHEQLPVEATFRLLTPQLFPQYEKILYLDGDIVVTRDVAELYDTNLGDCVIGASLLAENDPLADAVAKVAGVPTAGYFASGVLLIDSKRFTELDIAKKCFDLLCKEHSYSLLDQDVLNITCLGKVHFFSRLWNCSANTADTAPPVTPYIIHFAGHKPWSHPYIKYREHFWHYLKKTNYYESVLLNGGFEYMDSFVSTYVTPHERAIKQLYEYSNTRFAELERHIAHLAESVDKLAQHMMKRG